jgi:hypothetical protein
MLGGATISLILPKLIRSVARDGIWTFCVGWHYAGYFLNQRLNANAPLPTPTSDVGVNGQFAFPNYLLFLFVTQPQLKNRTTARRLRQPLEPPRNPPIT